MKKIFDLVLCVLASPVIIIVLIIVSLAVKLDSKGPVFFIQKRLGLNGEVFGIYKFRTMITDAEKIGTGIFTTEDDPRITKFGHFLRKTSLDEIPQLINVIKGDMSLVGPRPPVPYHPRKYEEYSEIQRIRFRMKPGITGLAQVTGRNHLSWDERIVADVEYVQSWSLWLDIKIIFKTLLLVVKKESIYRKE